MGKISRCSKQQKDEASVSSQPSPVGNRQISSRPNQQCQIVHQFTSPQSTRGTNPRQFQRRVPLACPVTFDFHKTSQRSIMSFFLLTSNARSILHFYNPHPAPSHISYNQTHCWFLWSSTMSQCPVHLSCQQSSNLRKLDIFNSNVTWKRERKRGAEQKRERPFSKAPGLGANPGAIF